MSCFQFRLKKVLYQFVLSYKFKILQETYAICPIPFGAANYSCSIITGESYGGGASYEANKPQYNGQDDLMGDFFDKEVAEGK